MTMPAANVFIAGSRAITRLDDGIQQRLDRIMAEGHHVLVGDASGADRIVQHYLSERSYANVTVYCTGLKCRNNVGHWNTMNVASPAEITRGFDFYAIKDRAMADAATHGLMLWDGESRGTLTNIKNLIKGEKPVVVYLSPAKIFVTVRNTLDLTAAMDQLAARHETAARRRA